MTVSATFPLIPEPAAPPGSASGIGSAELAPITDRTAGFGIVTPFRRDKRTDFAAGSVESVVQSAVGQVVGTRADDGRMTGELPWRTDFGSLVHRMLFLPLDETFVALMRSRVQTALAKWEPRARLRDIKILEVSTQDGGQGAVARVLYDLVQAPTGNVLARNKNLDIPLSG